MSLLLRRSVIAIVFVSVAWFALSALHQYLDPNTSISEEESEDARWIATSKYFLDRQSCRWLGLCGLAHYHPDPAWPRIKNAQRDQEILKEDDLDALWVQLGDQYGNQPEGGRHMKPEDLNRQRILREVPQYVLDAAPLIHLCSTEKFWPSDIADHLRHTTPHENHTSLHMNASDHTLHNLHMLNSGHKSTHLYMPSTEDVEQRPTWLGSAYNKPNPFEDEAPEAEEEEATWIEFEAQADDQAEWYDPTGPSVAIPFLPSFKSQPQVTGSSHRRRNRRHDTSEPSSQPGYSPAPATLILVDKGHDIVDAFWFYFYSYNLGTTVLNMRFGNHVGDWEHSLIRFYKGVPKAVFFSAHSGGNGYHFKAVEKGSGSGREGRPVLYSALGSHAMYATPGLHPYVLPFGLLADVTDKGPLWDPALNYRAYFYNTSITHNVDAKSLVPAPNGFTSASQQDSLFNLSEQTMRDTFEPAASNPNAPTSWFWFKGHWGDKFYELADWRQWRFVGQYHYVNGPLGPRHKNLGRSKVCQSGWACRILDSIDDKKGKSWITRRAVGEVRVPEA